MSKLLVLAAFNVLFISSGVLSCEEGGIAPNPEDCKSYILCLHGEEQVKECPSGLHYNKEQKICDWPANAKCESMGMPNDQPTTPPGPPPPHGSGPYFAPYFDVMLKSTAKLSEVAEKTGQLDYTLAFVLGSSAGCDPKWGAEKDLDDPTIIDEIRKVQAKGGQMIVALGGAVGPYLEHMCSTSDSLANAYMKILDVVKTNHLDVDVESPINVDMVNKALKKVQQERPGTTVSYTLMVQAEDYGLNPDLGVKVLESAKAHGVHVDIVNPMTMEFQGKSADWGDAVIGAAESVLRQMKAIWPEKSDGELKRMLGVTPMLGQNFNRKVFETKHGRKLVDWANQNHIGLLSFWSVARDNGNCAGGGISAYCSSTTQSDLEFTKVFQGFKN
ncbi:putative bifunctional chitinase/lysozyme [Orchesella cincta]|uniref:Putative bifunctional chitinase/lysozyme n=1 Tax=Orchesella cincta TaxID=48709 RepID=A0A1D2N432_ORCCI|nr:putative bifunctional chitinase/lysozyme [Orchesella cincta]